MTTRILPRDEYAKLAGTELDTVWPLLDQADGVVMVIEDGDQIVGCWAVMTVTHVEGLWIHPAHRGKASVGRRLLLGMTRFLRGRTVVTSATCDDVRRLLERVAAQPLPGSHYMVTFGGKTCPQQ